MRKEYLSKFHTLMDIISKPVMEHPGLYAAVVGLMTVPMLLSVFGYLRIIPFQCCGLNYPGVYFDSLSTVFYVAYTLCLLEKCLHIGRYILPVIALLLAVDIFLAANFSMGISPIAVQLLFQTNAGEAGEFLGTYLSFPSVYVIFATVFALCAWGLSGKFNLRMKGFALRHKRVLPYIICLLLVVPALWATRRLWNTCRLIVYPCNTVDLEHIAGKLPNDVLVKTLYSVKAVVAILNDIDKLHVLVSEVCVDGCRFTSPKIILVIGESFNKHHSNLYGYGLDTNPRLKARQEQGGLFVFTDAITPYNSTSPAMRHMLSGTRARHGVHWAEEQLFPTVFKKAGYGVLWMDNQAVALDENFAAWDFFAFSFIYEPVFKAHSFDYCNTQTFAHDGMLVDSFASLVTHGTIPMRENTLAVFHLYGQHLWYPCRYPAEAPYEHFTEADICRPDLSEGDRRIISQYDNATRYNDYVIDKICSYWQNEDAVLVYLSDHGEEVFDYRHYFGRLYTRPVPPGEAYTQFEIPMMIWCSDIYRKKHPDMVERIAASVDKPFMSDDLPHLLYDLAGIESTTYHPERSVLSPDYSPGRRPLLQSEDMIYEEIIKGYAK